MKELFPGYFPTNVEVPAWGDTTLVAFDANVLLNLYRFPPDAAQDVLSVMDALGDRAWLPHHVALEFHRNRPIVIAEQKRKFREAKDVVDTSVDRLKGELERLQLQKRHSTIDPTELVQAVDKAVSDFSAILEEQEENSLDVTDQDPILERLDGVFSGRVGRPPEGQPWVDALEKEGNDRFEKEIPPGYKDDVKGDEAFVHGGLVYGRRFGDLILWRQALSHCADVGIEHLVFVTDDDKADWWFTVESGGRRKLGPRPELVGELTRETGVKTFTMYSSERFVERYSSVLNINLRSTTVDQVRDVKSALHESVAVTCPSCGVESTALLGGESGSSAINRCDECHLRYHIHRASDGSVFTREHGGRGTTHRLHVECPSCQSDVPMNVRDSEKTAKRYCMTCCTLLEVDAAGEILSAIPSSSVDAQLSVTDTGNSLTCPACVDAEPTRVIWGNQEVLRAVCRDCGRLLEAKMGQ